MLARQNGPLERGVAFLRERIKPPTMGCVYLLGADADVWEKPELADLVVLKRAERQSMASRILGDFVALWWTRAFRKTKQVCLYLRVFLSLGIALTSTGACAGPQLHKHGRLRGQHPFEGKHCSLLCICFHAAGASDHHSVHGQEHGETFSGHSDTDALVFGGSGHLLEWPRDRELCCYSGVSKDVTSSCRLCLWVQHRGHEGNEQFCSDPSCTT